MALVHSRAWIAAALVAWSAACDSNDRMAGPDAQAQEAAFLAIVSNSVAIAAFGGPAQAAAGAAEVAYVSLPPGTIPGGEMATIENRRTGATVTTPVVGGGFDPVFVVARAGDTLQVEVRVGGHATPVRAASVVPPRRRPIVVRTDPPPGKRDVPLNASIVIVFSEPIEPATLNGSSIQVLQNGLPVDGRLGFLDPDQVTAEFVPAEPLLGATNYELRVTQAIRDLDGEALEQAVSVDFTTEIQLPLPGPAQIAFVSTRDGGGTASGPGSVPYIYVANADGSNVRRLTRGEMPAWSPDGRRIAFHRVVSGGGRIPGSTARVEIVVIEVNGTGERVLAEGANPAWSPDGKKIVFEDQSFTGGIYVTNADGPRVFGLPRLLSHDFANPGGQSDQVGFPTWSPDGRSITFVRSNYQDPWTVYIMNADGSEPRPLSLGASSRPQWSPDGSKLVVDMGYRIATANLDGSDFHIHVENTGYVGNPDWSPDGLSFVFEKFSAPAAPADQSYAAGTRMRIVVVDIQNGAVRQLIPEAVAPALPDYWDSQPVWSRVRR